MKNMPDVVMGLLAVSRDCFPIELSRKRRSMVAEECARRKIALVELKTTVENENDVVRALEEIRATKVNALVLYLGNFGPEGPTTLLAQKFGGPVMLVAAAEETGKDLFGGRGDAFCGLLSASYNVGLRGINVYIPPSPVATPPAVAVMVGEFHSIARVVLGVKSLKVFSFGPGPADFLTCHSPIKPLFDLGIEIMENSELDMFELFQSAKGDPRIPALARDAAKELGSGNMYPDLLEPLAQFEIALVDFMEKHIGASAYAVFANKCWPAFERLFGFVPCFINSRMAGRGIPISCEADIYGAVSEYLAMCATELPAAILDINNTVPADMYAEAGAAVGAYSNDELFMGFHCGNISSACMVSTVMKFQVIMHRMMEPGKEPNITRGTLEGQIRSGDVTIVRLQSTPSAELRAYVAQGEVLNIAPKSFGSIGVFGVREMTRFYRHVLLEKRFPHHTAVAFAHAGRTLVEAMRLLGVRDISWNRPKAVPYPDELPF